MQIFISHLIFILNLNFLKKSFKCVFKAFYSDQALWDYLDTCSTFSAVCKKRLVNKKFYVKKIIRQKIPINDLL